jgi:hypothetical protein
MRPVYVSEALKNSNVFHRNRFEVLRPRSDSLLVPSSQNIPRERSNSVKRKASGDVEHTAAKKIFTSTGPILEPTSLDRMERKVTVLKTLSSTLNTEVAKFNADPILEKILGLVCKVVDNIVDVQDELIKSCNVQIPPEVPELSRPLPDSDPDRDPHSDTEIEVFSQYSQVAAKKPQKQKLAAAPPPPKPTKDPKLQAFQDAVKHSERSTLIFNLNLGSKKILNEKTILSQATLALSAAAAEVEGGFSKTPTKETVAALDDVMSVTENVTLFGKVTKPYENKANSKDPKNKTFFTMPIRFEFKDKAKRLEAETILRDTCNIDCATPYPAILRSCIKQTVDHFRGSYPNDYIKVFVDTQKMALKVSRKVKGDGWYEHNDPIKLPDAVLDIKARFVPKGFVFTNLPSLRNPSISTQPSAEEGDMEEV